MTPSPSRWLLFIYRVPAEPSSHRTYLWRQLKLLGAVYLQQSSAILPDDPTLRDALNALGARVQEAGGEVSLLDTASPTEEWEAQLLARFREARDAEYGEVAENVERFEDEIRREERRGRLTFAELEDLEADWHKLEEWLARVERRDFFGTAGRSALVDALARAQKLFDAFAQAVYLHEGALADEPTETTALHGEG